MQRLFINGSPRGKNSNSDLILSWISEGLTETGAGDPPVIQLARTAGLSSHRQTFLDAEEVLLVFPLYTDSMPGLVKAFLESIADADPAILRGKRIAFVVQSGFPESIHSEGVAAYLCRLCERLGLTSIGIIIKGGVEGIRIRPPKQIRKIKTQFVTAGRELAGGGFTDRLSAEMAGKRKFSQVERALIKVISLTGLMNFYWNMMLKKHGAYERRFDAPYGRAFTRDR